MDARAGLRLSYASIAWTAVASTSSVVLGLRASSLVLVAFGLTGLLDCAGSVALVVHFRHAIRQEAYSEVHERFAHRIVSTGLLVTAIVTGVESIRRLIVGGTVHRSVAGLVIAEVSVVVLGLLARGKRNVARGIGSQALLADSYLSATGALLGIVTTIGVLGSRVHRADAVCALVVAGGAGFLAVRELRSAQR